MTRLTILDQDEIDALYKSPKFSYAEKESFFILSDKDTVYLNDSCTHVPTKINYILQLGYFRAVQYFFPVSFFCVREDVKFIITKYFEGSIFPKQNISPRAHYKNQKMIQKIYHFRPATKYFLETLRKQGQRTAKLDSKAKSIFYELLNYCNQKQVIRPVYSRLQTIVSLLLRKERTRLCYKLKTLLDVPTKNLLKNLLTTEELFYKLTLLRKDPKDFSTREIQKELKKRDYISAIFYEAEKILPIMDISNQNIQYYASLAEFYDVSKLRRLNSGMVHMYLLCFSWIRFKEINDHLVSYFIYKTNYYIKESTHYSEKEIYKAKLIYDSDRSKAGKILKVLSNQRNEDHELRPKVYKIVSEENFMKFTKRFNKPNFDNSSYEWQYYSKARHKIKTNLRPVFKVVDWRCQKKVELFNAVSFLLSYFERSKIFKKYKLSEIPMSFFPKRLKRYLKQKK